MTKKRKISLTVVKEDLKKLESGKVSEMQYPVRILKVLYPEEFKKAWIKYHGVRDR